MKVKYKEVSKFSNDLVVGDMLFVGGLLCTITKVEDIFHYVPNARIRLSMTFVGNKSKNDIVILFLKDGLPITTVTLKEKS